MIVQEQVWRTDSGRLVEPGHPEAAFLAFAAGQDVSDREAERLGLSDYLKSRQAPQGKMVEPSLNKGVQAPGKK